MAEVDDWLRQGLACHQAGRVGEAESFYERVLEKEPGNAEALYLLGTAAGQRGAWGRSVELIRRAIAVRQVGGAEGRYYNNLGIALKRQGLIDEAIGAYREALVRAPETPEALSNLGNLLAVKGRAEEAAAFCRRAVELRPGYAEAHYNLGLALEGLGKGREARGAYEMAAGLQPRMAEAQYRLGVVCKGQGDLARALASFQAALAARPGMAEALVDAGVVLEQLGRDAEAEERYREAIGGNPRNAVAQNNLGNLLRARGETADAVACYRMAVAAAPEFPEAWYNRAGALAALGERREAVGAFEKAIALRPGYGEALNNLGVLFRQMGRHEEALAAFEKALASGAEQVALLNNYGEALFTVQRFEEAINAYRRGLALPGGAEHAEILNNLAAALNMTGELDAAVDMSERAVRADPEHAAAWCNLGSGHRGRGEVEEALEAYRRAISIKRDPVWHSNLLYALHFHPAWDAQMLLAEHREWDRIHAAGLGSKGGSHENERRAGRRLRVGYVSPDFRSHPVGRFMAGPLEKHDAEAVEVFCYSDVIVPDSVTSRIQKSAHAWRNIQGLGDEEVARMVRRDGIDVLVDLTMHMNRNRLLVFARQPAPVQVTYLAYCSTTGLSAMDWRITDGQIDPAGTDGGYAEKSWRLPGSYWCYEAPAEAGAVGELPAARNGWVTFGCLNHYSKMSGEALAVWRELLHSVPGSRLILHAPPGRHRERVLAFFEGGGVARERIEFVALQQMPAYFATYGEIDVGLDPFPYAGGTTTCDALWMGVPVVTWRGKTAVGRGGASLMVNLGLEDLVAGTGAEYRAIAAGLARDVDRMRKLRAGMRERMRASPVMDARGLAKGLEQGFEAMWENWRGGSAGIP